MALPLHNGRERSGLALSWTLFGLHSECDPRAPAPSCAALSADGAFAFKRAFCIPWVETLTRPWSSGGRRNSHFTMPTRAGTRTSQRARRSGLRSLWRRSATAGIRRSCSKPEGAGPIRDLGFASNTRLRASFSGFRDPPRVLAAAAVEVAVHASAHEYAFPAHKADTAAVNARRFFGH
jgi:hypothetical protein